MKVLLFVLCGMLAFCVYHTRIVSVTVADSRFVLRRTKVLRSEAYRPVCFVHEMQFQLHCVRRTLSRRLPSDGLKSFASYQHDPTPKFAPVETGLDALVSDHFVPLRGKRIGLITNPTGVSSDLRADIDILARAPNVKLAALFAPEHGVRGDAGAGAAVGSSRDEATGLPVYSLYGTTRKPTRAMLANLDALVYDIQDIGARSYTYISTLGCCMEAAAENGIPFYVLDRPDPLGGERIEGNIPAPAYRSFVGRYPIPYLYGMTAGELAGMINGEGWLAGRRKCELNVIALRGWRRDMDWQETGLPWVPTSPHVPHSETALFYAATGIMGELAALNIGVGYTLPFELAGAPGIAPRRLADELNRRRIPGVTFRPATWVPYYAAHKGETCGGVQIHFTDPAHVPLTRINFEIIAAAKRIFPRLNFFPPDKAKMFDLVCGTDTVRKRLLAGKHALAVWNFWNADSVSFSKQRRKYLLYP